MEAQESVSPTLPQPSMAQIISSIHSVEIIASLSPGKYQIQVLSGELCVLYMADDDLFDTWFCPRTEVTFCLHVSLTSM